MRKYAVFLIIPAALLVIVWKLHDAYGVYYFSHNSDPAYLYLINSLNVATLQPVRHVDNPGTTVQVTGGIVIKALSLLRGEMDIEKDVLLHPELYLTAINKTLFAINVIAVFILGAVAFRLTKSIWLSLLVQSCVFGSWLSVKAMLMVSPEPVSIFTAILFILLIIWTADGNIHHRKPAWSTVLFALVTAFGLATKLTFIPLMLIPLIILPAFKWKAVYVLLTLVVVHIFLIPAYAHYDFLLQWIKMLLMNTRQYGQGAPELVDAGEAAFNLLKLIALEHPFFLALFFSMVMLAAIFRKAEVRKTLSGNSFVRLLLAVTLAAIFHTLLVAKNYSPRYLLPSLMLFTTLIYLNIRVYRLLQAVRPFSFPKVMALKGGVILLMACLLYIRHYLGYIPGDTFQEWANRVAFSAPFDQWLEKTFRSHPQQTLVLTILFLSTLSWLIYRNKISVIPWTSALTIILIAFAIAYQFRHIDIPGYYHRCEQAKTQALAVMEFMERQCSGCITIYGERSSSRFYALKYGTSTNFTQQKQLERMKELYPGKIYFWGLKLGDRYFESWTHRIRLTEILSQGEPVLLLGDRNNLTPKNLEQIESENQVRLMLLYEGRLEAVYRIFSRKPAE